MIETLQKMFHAWETGGWVMPALALLGIVMYASAAHLLLTLYQRGLTKTTDADLRRWVSKPEEAPKNVRELIRYTQDEVHSLVDIEGRFAEVEAAKIPDVDRRIAFLNVIVVSAPLFGLLGTVGGMLLTFKAIGVGGSSTSDIIAKGISEALVATQTGMMVAIPGFMLAHVAKRWRNEYASFLARLEGVTLRYFRREFPGMTRISRRPAKVPPAQPPTANTQPLPA
jgi:biopolymer transport protein ExbB